MCVCVSVSLPRFNLAFSLTYAAVLWREVDVTPCKYPHVIAIGPHDTQKPVLVLNGKIERPAETRGGETKHLCKVTCSFPSGSTQ